MRRGGDGLVIRADRRQCPQSCIACCHRILSAPNELTWHRRHCVRCQYRQGTWLVCVIKTTPGTCAIVSIITTNTTDGLHEGYFCMFGRSGHFVRQPPVVANRPRAYFLSRCIRWSGMQRLPIGPSSIFHSATRPSPSPRPHHMSSICSHLWDNYRFYSGLVEDTSPHEEGLRPYDLENAWFTDTGLSSSGRASRFIISD